MQKIRARAHKYPQVTSYQTPYSSQKPKNKERMMIRCKRVVVMLWCIVVASLMAAATMGTLEDDETECAEQLTSLASCSPYVSGTAKKPTQECCEDAKN